MTSAENANRLGTVAIAPAEPVVAGCVGTWRLTFRAGTAGIAVGGGVRVGTDSDTDWGIPQFVDPAGAEFMSAEAPDGVRVHLQTRSVKSIQAKVTGRALQPGEELTVIYGDTSSGGPGSRAQTFFEAKRYFLVSADAAGAGEWNAVENSPHVSIIGDEAVQLVVTAPSTPVVGEQFSLLIKAEDRWGNPSASYRGTVQIRGDGVAVQTEQITFGENAKGVCRIDGFAAQSADACALFCDDEANGVHGESNPIIATAKPSAHQLWWADPHGGQLIANEKFADFFRYARDVSGIQFVGFQRNADVLSKEDYEVQKQAERELYEPGRFVPIPGYEWSGQTWHGGHHNVYFRRHNQPIHRNKPIEQSDSVERETELRHVEDVYDHYRNSDTIMTPHVGGEHSNLDFHEPELEPGVEITSTHGSFEWMLRDSIERGYKLGFLGGNDCYTGRPGDDRPGFQLRRYSRGGLTGIYCEEISLPAFFEAMRARRTFATTGVRMVLRVDSDGHLMGSEYTTANNPAINVSVTGAGPLERVELHRGLELIHTWQPDTAIVPKRVRILCDGSSRMTSYSGVVWDGTLNVDGGTIRATETVRFDSPRSHIVSQDSESLGWHAWGCGYPMGLIVDLDGDDDTMLRVSVDTQTMTGPGFGRHGSDGPRRLSFAPSEGGTMCVRLGDLTADGETLDLGVLDRKLNVAAACKPGPRSAEFQVIDESPKPGINPYWVKVIQADRNLGWSSPVFCDFVAGLNEPC